MKTIYLATQNPGKVKEFQTIFDALYSGWTLLPVPKGMDFPETKETFIENAREKALNYAQALNAIVFSDDSGLVIPSLQGFPGIYSARLSSMKECMGYPVYPPNQTYPTCSTDRKEAHNREIVLQTLFVPSGDELSRMAYYTSAICVATPNEVLFEVEKRMDGEISRYPKGKNGFGYDAIFIPSYLAGVNGHLQGQTLGELPDYAKTTITHRYKSTRKLIEFLYELT